MEKNLDKVGEIYEAKTGAMFTYFVDDDSAPSEKLCLEVKDMLYDKTTVNYYLLDENIIWSLSAEKQFLQKMLLSLLILTFSQHTISR